MRRLRGTAVEVSQGGKRFSFCRTMTRIQLILFVILITSQSISSLGHDEAPGQGDASAQSEKESYLTILYPYKDSCFLSAEGLLFAAALSSHTWLDHPQDKMSSIFIDGKLAGSLELFPYELNHNNIHVDLGWLPDGVHSIMIQLANQPHGVVIAQESLEIRIGADHCEYECSEMGGGTHCPHAAPAPHVLQAQTDEMAREKLSDFLGVGARQAREAAGGPSEKEDDGGAGGEAGQSKHAGARVAGCNLALNRPAMQSSFSHLQRLGGAENAVDGLTSVGEAFVLTEAEEEAWWMVDLEAEREIEGMSVWVYMEVADDDDYPSAEAQWDPQGAPPASLTVTVYKADGSLASRHTLPPPPDPHAVSVISLSPSLPSHAGGVVVGRYVKVSKRAEGAGEPAVLGLREVKVEGTACWDCPRHCIHGHCRPAAHLLPLHLPAASAAGQEVCVCEADWVGWDCSANLLADVEFLPTPDTLPFSFPTHSPPPAPTPHPPPAAAAAEEEEEEEGEGKEEEFGSEAGGWGQSTDMINGRAELSGALKRGDHCSIHDSQV
jgi:hypothetical protein